MNCLEYRRQLATDPRTESAAMQAHRRDCPACAQGHARALGFELALRRSLKVPVPAGLEDRILLAQATLDRRDHGSRRRRWLVGVASAASVVLVAGVAWLWSGPAEAFPDLMVDHLAHEPMAFAAQAPLPADVVLQRFAKRNVKLAGSLPEGISYVQACPVGPYKSVHMVMPRSDGPVTVFYIADHREPLREDFRHGAWRGRSVPMGEGTLVLIAETPNGFDALEQSWRRTIEGGIAASAAGAP